MNYLSTFPNFIETQKTSFCWFLSKGLAEELSKFSQIHNFSCTTEYILFTNEYSLLKPIYNIEYSKKNLLTYSVQLVIPLEIRNKKLNTIQYYTKFPILNLPLMTNSATFIINGCERVIVSQIVRSPGIYFEKDKNKTRKKPVNKKLLNNLTKIQSFIPLGEPFLSEQTLVFFPRFYNKSIFDYSLNELRQYDNSYYNKYLELFNIYWKISKTVNKNKKVERIKLFLKWLKLQNIKLKFSRSLYKTQIFELVKEWNFLAGILVKYQILNKQLGNNFYTVEKRWNIELTKKLDKLLKNKDRNKKLSQYYENILKLKLPTHLFIILSGNNTNLKQINQFKFLTRKIKKITKDLKSLELDIEHKSFKPIIYFSSTLKELDKYRQKDNIEKPKYIYNNFFKYNYELNLEKIGLKYLKNRSEILKYKNYHNIKDSTITKYENKQFYSAVIIPQSGSWIRIKFQKNSSINKYKYLLKNREDEIIVQLDKFTQIPLLLLFKEMGLTDIEICRNLQHSDFFYFTNPLLTNSISSTRPLPRFNFNLNYENDISEFIRIFDNNYYYLGNIGRFQFNNKLSLNINSQVQSLTYEDIFAVVDKLLTLCISKEPIDDIDHLQNRRVRSIGELLQNLLKVGFQRLKRKLQTQNSKEILNKLSIFNIIGIPIKEFFSSSQLSQYMDQTNPLASLTHRRRISGLGPGGFDKDKISFAVRDIHPSHYGRICPIETPEGQNIGLIASLTTCARINKLGFIETPFWRVLNGRVIKTKYPIYLTADIEDQYKIAPADIPLNENNYLMKNIIPVRYNQTFINSIPSEIDFISISTVQIVSIAASLIPFFEHDDANRALMGSNMQRQSLPLIFPQKPIVGTGLENQVANNSGMAIIANKAGIVDNVTSNQIIILNNSGTKSLYSLQKYQRSNQGTCINQRPIVWKGENISFGQMLTDGPGIQDNELSLGQNVLIAYMPWYGYNFEDAILISERLVYDDIFTSIHIEKYDIEINQTPDISEKIIKSIPGISSFETQHLNEDGIVSIGTYIEEGNILVGKICKQNNSDQLPEEKLLKAIFGTKVKNIRDTSFRMPKGESGRVTDVTIFNKKIRSGYKIEKVQIHVAQIKKIKVGDKIAGRHGNKGIISKILSKQDMPFLPDGTPIDIILNPLGVPSRMNVGQIYECLLGLAGDKLNCRFKILPFDEMYGLDSSRILVNKKLRKASIERNEAWLFNPYSPGKIVLIDGRTGKPFENPVTVGNAYMLKLNHLVDKKMHSRSTGPYSLITQQPLGGKSKRGGQRFGEMEVWALEGFGASYTLRELLTIKSDDIKGRNKTLNAIIKGKSIPLSGIPESFKVLLQELRSIGLDIGTYKMEKFNETSNYELEVNLIENLNSQLQLDSI